MLYLQLNVSSPVYGIKSIWPKLQKSVSLMPFTHMASSGCGFYEYVVLFGIFSTAAFIPLIKTYIYHIKNWIWIFVSTSELPNLVLARTVWWRRQGKGSPLLPKLCLCSVFLVLFFLVLSLWCCSFQSESTHSYEESTVWLQSHFLSLLCFVMYTYR